MAEKPVKCSSCKVSANVETEDNTPLRVICPQCGTSESYEAFQESVQHQMAAFAAGEIGRTLNEIAKGSKSFKYKPGNLRPHSPKFQLDFSS